MQDLRRTFCIAGRIEEKVLRGRDAFGLQMAFLCADRIITPASLFPSHYHSMRFHFITSHYIAFIFSVLNDDRIIYTKLVKRYFMIPG